MSKQRIQRKTEPVKAERDRVIESYAQRLKNMGADKVLLQRIEDFQKTYRPAR